MCNEINVPVYAMTYVYILVRCIIVTLDKLTLLTISQTMTEEAINLSNQLTD